LHAIHDGNASVRWCAEDAGFGNLFLHSYGKVLQCTPDGKLQTSSNRRSWETWKLIPCSDHENICRDMFSDDEPLMAVSSLMPLMRSYFRSLACSTHKVNPIPLAKAMTLGLAYFLGEKCGWKVTLPVEVCRDLSVTENREQERCSKAKEKEGLSVLSWQETILAFTPCTGTVYVVDFDFKHKFNVLRKTDAFAAVYRSIPNVFLGTVGALAKEVERISESLVSNFQELQMSVPWWRTASNMKNLYQSCINGDATGTHMSLGKLGDLLGLPQFDDSNGVHQLVQSLREFVNREESATNSPAGALKTALTNIRRTYHHPAPSPCIKESWEFDKIEKQVEKEEETNGHHAPKGSAPSLLSQVLKPKMGWEPPRTGGYPRAPYSAIEQVTLHQVLRHVTAHGNLCDLAGSPQF
jgi:uncharacterized protein (TIGR01615 family)